MANQINLATIAQQGPPGSVAASVANATALGTTLDYGGTSTAWPTGTRAYTQDKKEYWTLDRTSTLTPDGSKVVAAQSGVGNWVLDPLVGPGMHGLASPSEGDLPTFDGTQWTRLPAGSAGQILTLSGNPAVPGWAAAQGLTTVATRTALSAVTDSSLGDGSLAFNTESLYRAPWTLDKLSTLTADGVTVLATKSGTGRWILTSRYQGTAVPITEVGADPTGATDSSTAITNAGAALNGSGVALFIPGGTYAFATAPTIPAGVRVVLGMGVTFTGAAGTATHAALIAATGGPIDFVRDCGADPTGANDCAPALNTAYALLSSLATAPATNGPLDLFIPPGFFKVASQPTMWNLSGKGTSLRIRGAGDASILSCAVGSANWMLAIENISGQLSLEDFAVQGTSSTAGGDCNYGIYLGGISMVNIRRVHFDWISATTAVVYSNGSALYCDSCLFSNAHTNSSSYGTVHCYQVPRLCLDQCYFVDPADLNGQLHSSKANGNAVWVHLSDSIAVGAIGQLSEAVFRGCLFDEGASASIVATGGPTANIERIRIEHCFLNPMDFGTSCMTLTKVNLVEIDGLTNSGFNTGLTPNFLTLSYVRNAKLRGMIANPAAASNKVSADTNCGLVEFDSCDANVLAALASSAAATIWKGQVASPDLGALSDVRSSGAAVSAGALVKPSGTAFVPLATTDDSGACAGVSLDAAAGSGSNIRVARIGQPVTVLNDGGAAIAVGDKIIPSATTAGQVTHSTTAGKGTVGVALTAAAASAGTAFQILFMPGVV